MSTIIYRDSEANAIFIEDANGAQFLNALHATVDNNLLSITDTAKNFDLVSSLDHNEIVDQNGLVYGATSTEACDALNAIFTTSGSTGEVPSITSNTTVNLTTGDTLNYELTSDYGVGYEWDSLPSGVVTVDGNIRKLIGGSNLTAGTYTPTAKAINYFGEDSETITINVSNPPFSNSKSVQFQNQDWLGANASLLNSILGRSSNGSGSSDAWSMSFYWKGSSSSQGQTIFYFGDNDVTNGGYIQLMQISSSGNKLLRLKYGTSNNNLRLQTGAGSITENTWHHVLITYDGGTTGSSSADMNDYYGRFKIFIDNVEQTTSNSNSNFGYTGGIDPDNLRVGRFSSGNYMRNGSKVDELAFWGSDQSGNASDIYNGGTPFDLNTLSSPPPHWIRMGDGDTFPFLQDSGTVGNCTFQMYNMTVADIVNDTP
jgi:hypothetical protein